MTVTVFGYSPVKMFLSSRQAGYSNRQQRQPRPEYKSDKCEVSRRYFVVGGQMAGWRHILTGLGYLILISMDFYDFNPLFSP